MARVTETVVDASVVTVSVVPSTDVTVRVVPSMPLIVPAVKLPFRCRNPPPSRGPCRHWRRQAAAARCRSVRPDGSANCRAVDL